MKFLRRVSLVLFVVLPPLFAWGCGPAPTWRKLVGEVERCKVFPECNEILIQPPWKTNGIWIEVVDATTGVSKRRTRLPPNVSPSDPLARGRILAWSDEEGPLVYFSDFERPPAKFPRHSEVSETLNANVDPTGRWLISTVYLKNDSPSKKIATLVYDIDSRGPLRVFPDVVGTHLDDGVHLMLREADAAEPFRERPGKFVKWSCVDLQSGKTIWETQILDQFRQAESVPDRHWIVFHSGTTRPDGLDEWLIIDDRTGIRVIERGLERASVSARGVFISVNAGDRIANVIRGAGQVQTIDLEERSRYRSVFIDVCRPHCRRLSAEVRGPVVDIIPIAYQSTLNRWIVRMERTLWDLDTGRLVDRMVQYPHWPSEIAWNGVFSPDGEFEIQKFNVLGVRWIQRIDWPAQRNTPLRIAVAVAPAALLLWMFVRRRFQRYKAVSPAKAIGDER